MPVWPDKRAFRGAGNGQHACNAFGECGEGFIRACYASSMENIYEALRRIERFVKEEL